MFAKLLCCDTDGWMVLAYQNKLFSTVTPDSCCVRFVSGNVDWNTNFECVDVGTR